MSRSAKKSQKKAARSGIDSNVEIHWRELETMASDIVENVPPEDIPSAPINILRDVIGLRKRSARFLNRSESQDNEEQRFRNATHEHIINVLERVLAKFEAVRAKVQRPERDTRRSAGGIQMDLADLNNMFEHLEVEESPDAADDDIASDVENQAQTLSSGRVAKAKASVKRKLRKGGKAKEQRVPTSPRTAHDTGLDPSWMDDVNFGLEDEQEDEDFDYYMMIYCFF